MNRSAIEPWNATAIPSGRVEISLVDRIAQRQHLEVDTATAMPLPIGRVLDRREQAGSPAVRLVASSRSTSRLGSVAPRVRR